MRRMIKIWVIIFLFLLTGQNVLASVVDDLNQQIAEKQDAIKKLETQINVYKKDIEVKQSEANTLNNQLSILKSKISKIELDIRLNETQIESLDLELTSLGSDIGDRKEQIEQQKKYLNNLLRLINISDQKNYLNIILTNPSFSEFFNQTKYLEDLNSQINQGLKVLKNEKQNLESKEKIAEGKKNQLVTLKKELVDYRASLTEQKEAKNYLLTQTKQSESKFRSLLAQLQQEQSSYDQEIATLQRKIQKELTKDDRLDNSASVLSWPARSVNGISAYFRDPDYPFRYLFEHTGIDLPIKSGTPVKAAASGYIAWARNNKSYGNNIMVIHNEGIATVYAHLSRFNVKEGEYVKRGEIIAYSGGIPGTPGAGFSTGAHLHFEVRINGLPVDPLDYLE
ncbi:MAG TPA: peptidoglycan DD-metalloendopeptidase family protein [Candidatus Magasanikbacteria bacterium]|nr:peptidoglycan DD-metalloendopeptidase family protein [Candidatus Magasanikbacteria bacterium]